MTGERSEWAKERIKAHIWWCGDYECDCVRPVIERISPNREAGYPWIKREVIWEGTFVSVGGSGYPEGLDYGSLEAELREACDRLGVELPQVPA